MKIISNEKKTIINIYIISNTVDDKWSINEHSEEKRLDLYN